MTTDVYALAGLDVTRNANGSLQVGSQLATQTITFNDVDDKDMLEPSKMRDPRLGLLPVGTRWVDSDRRLFLVEVEPAHRLINYHGRHYQVWVPWSYFIIDRVNRCIRAALVSPTQITSLDDDLHCMPLPNVYDDGHICGTSWELDDVPSDASHLAAVLIDQFWSSEFNADVMACMDTRFVRSLGGGWENCSGDDDHDEDDRCCGNYGEVLHTWEGMSPDEVEAPERWDYPPHKLGWYLQNLNRNQAYNPYFWASSVRNHLLSNHRGGYSHTNPFVFVNGVNPTTDQAPF